MARSTYLAKIAREPSHVAPTLSMGITINHVVSMTVPAIGGMVWMRWGHPWVFLGASGVAVLMFVFSSFVYVPPSES
jgi:hypothetical protein